MATKSDGQHINEEQISEDELNSYLARMFYGFICGITIFFVIGTAIARGLLAPSPLMDEVVVMTFFCIVLFGGLWVGMAFGKAEKYKLIGSGLLMALAVVLLGIFTLSGMEMPRIDRV